MTLNRITTIAASIVLTCCAGALEAQQPIGILLAAGDVAKCGGGPDHVHDEATAAVLLQQVKDADAQNIPVHVLALGDLAYDNGTAENFKCFDDSWGALLRMTLANSRVEDLILPVPGNHEYTNSASAVAYFDFFAGKNKAGKANSWIFQQDPTKKARVGYYALNFPDPTNGPWRLIGLNSERSDEARAKQAKWLGDDLRDSKSPCVLAFWHRPLFSSGMHGHGDCKEGKPCKKQDAPLCRPDENAPDCKSMKRMQEAYKILYEQGASVVLTGHDHHYEQFKRLDADARESQKGVRSFIVGTGGSPLYQAKRDHRWKQEHEVYSHGSYGVLRIELFPEQQYRWSFVPAGNSPAISLEVNGVKLDNDTCNKRP